MIPSFRRSSGSLLSLATAWLVALCLTCACTVTDRDNGAMVLTPAPPWTALPPTLQDGRWLAAGRGEAETVDQAQGLAEAGARAGLMAFRTAFLEQIAGAADDLGDLADLGDLGADHTLDRMSARLASLDSRDLLTLSMPADGERFSRRLADGSVEAFVQVSVDDLELFPQRRVHEAAALQDPQERGAKLVELARTLLLQGLDASSQTALELAGKDPALGADVLMELAGLHLLLGRRDEALAANARALERLSDPTGDPAAADAQRARALEQQARLESGIASIEDSLLDLERLTRAIRHEDVLTTSRLELLCEEAQLSTVELSVGSDAGRLVPLWLDADGLHLVKLSDEGRVNSQSVQLSVTLPPGVDSATLLVWLLPEHQPVLEIVDSLRGEHLPSDDSEATDDQRLLLQALLEGLRKASPHPGVGAVKVSLHR